MPKKIPQSLGRYEILEELGRGAMGVVYLARDPLIGRLVALKTFRSGYSEGDKELQEFRARFLREAQSAGILNHPSIVTIHDVVDSSDEEGATFIAMEYVQGTNLKERLQAAGPLEIRRAIDIIQRIADGLDYAHDRGVVHRDIKPANIILTREGAPKITDFGIARLDTSDLTQEGQLLGTPNYMAPERILGRDVDHRTDIFSLGVLLYEMLTCHKPFQGDNLTMVTHRIVYEPFTPPEKYDSSIPAGVVSVLQRSMSKEPTDRYPRAGEMAGELRTVLAKMADDSGSLESRLSETQDVSGQLAAEAVRNAVADATRAEPINTEVPPDEAPAVETGANTVSLAPEQRPRVPGALAGGPSSLLRIALVLAVVGCLASVGWFLVVSRQPPVERPSAEAVARTQYLPMLREARRQLDQGRPDLAQGHVDQALAIGPSAGPVLELHDEIQRALSEAAAMGAERERASWVAEGQSALESAELDQAEAAYERLINRDPEDEDAAVLRVAIDTEIERREDARQARIVAARAKPEPPPQTVEEEPREPPAALSFPMAITFFTEVSRGSMRLWVNDRLILNESFKFVEKVGFLKTEDRHGRFDAKTEVDTGPIRVRVEVDPRGGSAVEGHFVDSVEDGEQRVLEIRFDAAANLSIGLRSGEPLALEALD